MSTTKTNLNPRIQKRVQTVSQNTYLQLEINTKLQNTQSASGSVLLVFNNFITCDKCFGYNPRDNVSLSSKYLSNVCPECGNKGVRYLSTASNKLFDYVHKNVY